MAASTASLDTEVKKMEPEIVDTPEGTLQYYRTNFESIPLGRSSRNSAGYRQLGSYSTRLNEKGQKYFEISLTLEGPPQKNKFVY